MFDDADGGPDRDGEGATVEGDFVAAFETLEDLGSPTEGSVQGAVQKHDEFVSSQASGEILGTNRLSEGAGEMAKDLVSGVVTEAIVDAFEAIEVEHEE